MPDQKKHLYLLFDDWESGPGYSIRKVSLSRRSGKRKQGAAEPLPGAFMRIRAPRGFPDLFTSGFGSRIMAMHHGLAGAEVGIPMIDVQELTFNFGPEFMSIAFFPIYFPIGDNKLFALDFSKFHCYLWTPEHSEEEPWGWKNLPFPPFKRVDVDVSSYGVQPDGCILVSTNTGVTFIFDTKEDVWKRYGNWALPFTGRCHYDTSLDGFVGLSNDPETLGYLYCCSTMTDLDTDTDTDKSTLHTSPDCKRTKEKVYNKNPAEEVHVSATLVHMSQGKFCIVECVTFEKGRPVQELRESWVHEFELPPGAKRWEYIGGGPRRGRCIYRLNTFSLSYDKEGDLKIENCKGRCYTLPHEARIGTLCMEPVAFWL